MRLRPVAAELRQTLRWCSVAGTLATLATLLLGDHPRQQAIAGAAAAITFAGLSLVLSPRLLVRGAAVAATPPPALTVEDERRRRRLADAAFAALTLALLALAASGLGVGVAAGVLLGSAVRAGVELRLVAREERRLGGVLARAVGAFRFRRNPCAQLYVLAGPPPAAATPWPRRAGARGRSRSR